MPVLPLRVYTVAQPQSGATKIWPFQGMRSERVHHVGIWRTASVINGHSGFYPMTRKAFHIVLAFTLVLCALSPYVELCLNWGQSLFDTGYDTETSVAVIALLLILAFAVAKLLIYFLRGISGQECLVDSRVSLRSAFDFVSTVPDVSPPPLPLRI